MQQQNSGAMISSPTTTSARFHMSRDDKAVLESDEELKETVQDVPLKILGLCGGIGSGKSYASSLLVSSLQCVAHINVDTLAHGVYSPGNPAVEEIKREFNEVVGDDGIVNRADLGRIVFSDLEAMSTLERIVWPHVKTLLLQQISDIQISFKEEMQAKSSLNTSESVKKVPVIVVEAAVLLDADWDSDSIFDAIWIITTSQKTAELRLIAIRGMEEKDAIQRIEAQKCRRGMGNPDIELRDGNINKIILNDYPAASSEENEDSDKILLKSLQAALIDPSCWKDGRSLCAL